MDEITLKDFRCFHDKQTARLAPLTLLVGENSTGKTSFMAMIRALLDLAYEFRTPNFKEAPYDLGSFDEIAHHRGARGGHADAFEAGFSIESKSNKGSATNSKLDRIEVTFEKGGTAPALARRRLALGNTWIEERFKTGQLRMFQVGTQRGSWERQVPSEPSTDSDLGQDHPWFSFLLGGSYLELSIPRDDRSGEANFKPLSGSPAFSQKDANLLLALTSPAYFHIGGQRLFASAPVRSKPRRTYDPSRPTPDPEGDYVPMYLAALFFQKKQSWEDIKKRLEGFGESSGLFNEISIKPLGKRESEPFQVQVRKFGGQLKGPRRNIIDVGYGVSQVLPVITELLRPNAPSLFLLQQPEVHLHPSAQAALGSLFCQIAGPDRQLVVETHSDHLLDRVRMDVRDGASGLRPEDVSILFFERGNLDVRIHSLRIDGEGNILGAPDSYRGFFMEETQRSLVF